MARKPRLEETDIHAICTDMLGVAPTSIAFPGGKDRKTVAVNCDGRDIILSRRRSAGRAKIEARVLAHLKDSPHVPDLLQHKDKVVLQHYVSGERLTLTLDRADEDIRGALLIQAIDALFDIQAKGHAAGLSDVLPEIGQRDGWDRDLALMPDRVARELALPRPDYDRDAMLAGIAVRDTRFIKWDARPGNALHANYGRIVWIDWEHCGTRRPSDDLAWLMADEWTPHSQTAEAHIASLLSPEQLEGWRIMAILHSCIRLSLIISRKPEGKWWNYHSTLQNDRIGITPFHVQRLCRRAARWSSYAANTTNLIAFFQAVEETLLAQPE